MDIDDKLSDYQKQQIQEERRFKRLIISVGIGLLVIAFIFSAFYIVNAGERAVLVTLGNPSDALISEGIHFKMPMFQSAIIFDIKTQKDEVEASSASKDLQTVNTKIAVNYHLESSSAPRIYREVGRDYVNRILSPAIQESTKASTALYTAEELITKREQVREAIKQLLKEKMAPRGIVIEDVLITNFDFSESFNAAIEAKVTAEQNALAAKNKLEQVKYEAEQAIEAARGRAEALQIEGDALRSNPQITTLRAVEKWNGIMPNVVGGATPFFDVGSLIK